MSKIKIGALGGLGENGKNMLLIEVDDHIFILDAGLKYPDVDMYGVDAVVPDMNYLLANKDKIQGIFISHGHEDHIGALPYLLEIINVPVFGTHFTVCLIEDLLTENKMNIKNYRLYRLNENKVLTFDHLTVSFFNTTHSIPESVGISINTEDGAIVYLTDFTFSFSSGYKYQTSFDKITELGKSGVLIALPESIGSNKIGRISNDSLLEFEYKKVLSNTKGRIIVSCFSSDLSRIQKVIDMSVENGKNIAILGRRAQRIIDIAISSDYLKIPNNRLKSLKFIDDNNNNSDENLVVIVTGIRQEPYSILSRMAAGMDRLIKMNPADSVVIMSPPIPGTEKYATDALNNLYRYDINVSIFNRDILKSTHASPDDLKLLYSMLKPKYVIPIKGEYRHLYEHYMLAKTCGYSEQQLVLLENGEFATFENSEYLLKEKMPINEVLIDGNFTNINENVLKERETLAEEGIIMIVATINLQKKQITSGPEIFRKGFVSKESNEINQKITETSTKIIDNYLTRKKFDNETLTVSLKEEIGKIIYRYNRKRPIVVPQINIILGNEEKKQLNQKLKLTLKNGSKNHSNINQSKNSHNQTNHKQLNNEQNGHNQVMPNNGHNQVMPNNGHNQVMPNNGNKQVKTDNGNKRVKPNNGQKQVKTDNGNKQVISNNGNKQVISNNGQKQVKPGNGQKQVIPNNGNKQVMPNNGQKQVMPNNGNKQVKSDNVQKQVKPEINNNNNNNNKVNQSGNNNNRHKPVNSQYHKQMQPK